MVNTKTESIMKTTKIFFGILAASLMMAGCQKEDIQAVEPEQNDGSQELVAGDGQIIASIPAAETKTTYGTADADGNYPVVWATGDAVKVYNPNTESHAGVIYNLSSDPGASEAVFTVAEGSEPVTAETRYAVYPASAANVMSAAGELRISLAGLRTQEFHSSVANNKNNIGDFPLWAKSENNSTVFEFENLCGAVLFQFNDYQGLGLKLQTLKLTSAKQYISGRARFNPENITETLTLVENGGEAGKSVSATYEELKIYSTPAATGYSCKGFILALPATTYEAGELTATITDTEGRVYTATIPQALTIKPGVTTVLPVMNFTLYYGTANSVMVAPGASAEVDATPYYTFKSNMTYENKPILDADGNGYVPADLTASVVWEQADGADALVAGSVLSSCTLEGTKINVTAGSSAGNAVVAIKSGETILWSYHIWVVDGVVDQKYTYYDAVQPTFMDRNLGATDTALGDRDSFGLFYEWGRKDPFAIKKNFTRATGTVNETYTTKYYTTDIELTGLLARTTTTSVATAIQNPDKRIYYDGVDTDWYRSGGIAAFWGDSGNEITTFAGCADEPVKRVKTVYDPCPAGYMVPSYYHYSALSCGTGTDKTTSKTFTANKGWTVTYDGTGTATWPLTGYISQVSNTDKEGVYYLEYRSRYWSSSVSAEEKSLYFYFNLDGMGNTNANEEKFASLRTAKRTLACPIRCVKIEE